MLAAVDAGARGGSSWDDLPASRHGRGDLIPEHSPRRPRTP